MPNCLGGTFPFFWRCFPSYLLNLCSNFSHPLGTRPENTTESHPSSNLLRLNAHLTATLMINELDKATNKHRWVCDTSIKLLMMLKKQWVVLPWAFHWWRSWPSQRRRSWLRCSVPVCVQPLPPSDLWGCCLVCYQVFW